MGFFSQIGKLLESAGFYVVEKVSPFTDVEVCTDGTVRVEFQGSYFECIALNDIPVTDILESSKKQFSHKWKKRFVEDLTQVMAGMGKHPKGGVVKLALRDLDSGQLRTVADAPLTKENRACLKELKEIPLTDVPLIARKEVDRRIARLTVDRVLGNSLRSVYRFQGNVGKAPIQIKVHLRSEVSQLYVHKMEIQLETRSSHRSLKGKHVIDQSLVPAVVIRQANNVAEQLGEKIEEISSVKEAAVQGRKAYDIKGRSGACLVEVEILDDGQILEVELENRPNGKQL